MSESTPRDELLRLLARALVAQARRESARHPTGSTPGRLADSLAPDPEKE